MDVKTIYKLFRPISIFIMFLAMAMPIHLAHADGGGEATGGPRISSSSDTSSGSSKFQNPFKKKKEEKKSTSTQKKQNTTTRTRQSTASKPVQRRHTVRRVETAPSGLPPAGETRFAQNEVIVRFQLASTAGSRNRAVRDLGLTHLAARTFFLAGVTVHRYLLPPGADVREVITQLEASGAVVYAQPNYIYVLQQSDTPGKLPQFGNDMVGLSEAHATTKGDSTRIAIIDTAVDGTHSEFSNMKLSSFDVSDGGSNVDPHGTSIAGILAADEKLTGVAPNAEIVSIAAFSKDASGTVVGNTWTIMEALNVALEQNVDILNMSFAGPADPLLENSMEGARKRNMMPVAAAGNEGPDAATLFPAGYEAVIAVTATDTEKKIYSKANADEHVDISAPGVGLLVLGNSSGFRTASGTSMATAYISGIAALALSANPGTDYATLRAMLENSATDLGEPGKDSVFGAGMPSAAVAISGLTN